MSAFSLFQAIDSAAFLLIALPACPTPKDTSLKQGRNLFLSF